MYTQYQVSLKFRNGVAGSIPLDQNLVRRYIDLYGEGVSNMLKVGKAREGVVTEEAMDAFIKAATTVFRIDGEGPYLANFQINAMLRDAAKMANIRGSSTGLLAFSIMNGGIVAPERIHLGKEPHLTERPIAPIDRGVRRASLAVFQIVENAEIQFPLRVIENNELPQERLSLMWEIAQEIGLGGFRHLGYGKFDLVSLTS